MGGLGKNASGAINEPRCKINQSFSKEPGCLGFRSGNQEERENFMGYGKTLEESGRAAFHCSEAGSGLHPRVRTPILNAEIIFSVRAGFLVRMSLRGA